MDVRQVKDGLLPGNYQSNRTINGVERFLRMLKREVGNVF